MKTNLLEPKTRNFLELQKMLLSLSTVCWYQVGCLMLACALFLPLAGQAALSTWTNKVTAGAAGNWNNAASWNPNGAPTGAATLTNAFFTGSTVSNIINSTNNIASPFFLNALNLGGNSPAASSAVNGTNNIYGNTLAFTNNGTTGPTLGLLALIVSSNLTYNVYMPIDLNTNMLTIYGDSNGTFNVNGVISGSGGLIKNGSNTVSLLGANTYSGTTLINAGTLNVTNTSGLGSTSGGTVVSSGAALRIPEHATIAENLTLSGTGVGTAGNSYGALLFNKNTGLLTLSGLITLNGGAAINSYAANVQYITNSQGIVGTGNLELRGSAANNGNTVYLMNGNSSYSGDTILSLLNSQGVTAQNGVNNALPITTVLRMQHAGGPTNSVKYRLNGFSQEIAGLESTYTMTVSTNHSVSGGAVTLSTLIVNNSKSYIFNGQLGYTNANDNNLAFVKTGTGNLTLGMVNSRMHTLTGGTSVSNGALLVNSILPGTVTVYGGVLGGNGFLTNSSVTVESSGAVGPGATLGVAGTLTLTNSSLVLNSESMLNMDLADVTTVGGGANDLLDINGNLTLNGTIFVNAGFLPNNNYATS